MNNWLRFSAVLSLCTAVLVVIFLKLLPIFFPPLPLTDGSADATGLVSWAAENSSKMFPWPIVVLVGIWLFFRSPTAFSSFLGIFRFVRKVKAFGAEVELTEQSKRSLQAAASEIVGAISEYRRSINDEMSRLIDTRQVNSTVRNFVEKQVLPLLTNKLGRNFRCALHVADPVLKGELCQLVDYYPPQERGGAGRPFSERYGIIGKVWRSGERQAVGTLFEKLPPNATREDKLRRIISDWGMNRDEAERAITHPSYICFLIHKDDGDRLATFFMDSTDEFAFVGAGFQYKQVGEPDEEYSDRASKNMEQIADDIASKAQDALAKKISDVVDRLEAVGPRIDLTRPR